MKNNQGFTLIELLVVVLIIGVLAVIVTPIYQTAVDKSNYANMMIPARSLATAQESFFMTNGHYSSDLAKLDVDFANNISGYSDKVTSNITATISDSENWDYVKVSRDGMNNNYIIYLNKSGNFAGDVHCEALKNNARAERLCKELGGKRIHGSLTEGYNTYILSGLGKGVSLSVFTAMNGIVCEASENSGTKSCEVTRYNNSVIKTVCKNKNDPKTCTHYIYDEDASSWECVAGKSKLVGGTCVATGKGTYLIKLDEDGKRTERQCDNYDTTKQACSQIAERTYDINNTKIESDTRYCETYDDDGGCLSYKQNKGYDSFGTLPSPSGTPDYDHNPSSQSGSLDFANSTTNWAQLNCATVDSDGACTSYKDGWFETSTWDGERNRVYEEFTYCSSVTNDQQCNEVSSYKTMQASYNESGKVENATFRECLTRDSSGNCTKYSNNSNNNYSQSYTYNDQNKTTSDNKYSCKTVGSNGECTEYKSSVEKSWTWNGYASKATSEIIVNCGSYNEKNQCTSYKPETQTFRTYAADNVTQTTWTRVKCNKYTGLECTGGYNVDFVPIVNGKEDTANRVIISNCMSVDMTNGQCLD